MEYGHGGDIYRNRNVELDFSVNVNPLGNAEFCLGGSPEEHCTSAQDIRTAPAKTCGDGCQSLPVSRRTDDLRKRGGGTDLPAGTGGTAEKGSDPCPIFCGV